MELKICSLLLTDHKQTPLHELHFLPWNIMLSSGPIIQVLPFIPSVISHQAYWFSVCLSLSLSLTHTHTQSINVCIHICGINLVSLWSDHACEWNCIIVFLAHLPYFEEGKPRLMRSPCCLCVCISHPLNFWMPEPIFMELPMYIMAYEHLSVTYVYFINIFHQSVCLNARQWHSKNVTMATNAHATIEELLDFYFLCGPGCIKGK
jgi:hypothetical protein